MVDIFLLLVEQRGFRFGTIRVRFQETGQYMLVRLKKNIQKLSEANTYIVYEHTFR